MVYDLLLRQEDLKVGRKIIFMYIMLWIVATNLLNLVKSQLKSAIYWYIYFHIHSISY